MKLLITFSTTLFVLLIRIGVVTINNAQKMGWKFDSGTSRKLIDGAIVIELLPHLTSWQETMWTMNFGLRILGLPLTQLRLFHKFLRRHADKRKKGLTGRWAKLITRKLEVTDKMIIKKVHRIKRHETKVKVLRYRYRIFNNYYINTVFVMHWNWKALRIWNYAIRSNRYVD